MYYNDHVPPHFHAIYAEHDSKIDIETGQIIAGSLPRRAHKLVQEWTALHRDELRQNWDLLVARVPLNPIPPLP
jgi:hypothetical protein